MIRSIDVDIFRATENGNGSIGAHFRHNLDFVNSFLNGITERRIDYNNRPRNAMVETQPTYAIEQIRFAIGRLKNLEPEMFDRIIMVRSEINEDMWNASSIAREIEFLHSHTVHHYALIARLIPDSVMDPLNTFGVAPSTLRFRAAANR